MRTSGQSLLDISRAPGLDAANLCEAFQVTTSRHGDLTALRTPGGSALTWAEYAHRVERLAGGLSELGVGAGDTVGLMLANRPEFNLVDTALLHLGAIAFSIYNSSAPEQIEYLFSHSRNRVVITERRFEALIRAVAAPGVEHIIVVEDGLPEAEHPDFEAAWRAVGADDVASLIYTSGTTGSPKAVQLTHRNIMCALDSYAQAVPLRPTGRLVSYLPAAHLSDRFAVHYSSLVTGSSITAVDDPNNVLAGLVDARPTSWLGVPRIWEKFKAALEAKGITDPSVLSPEERTAARAHIGLDQLDYGGSGGAPIPPGVIGYFTALDLPILEGWAMSENTCAGTMNSLGDRRTGTVGKAMPGVELKLADDGELLQRGPTVTPGYLNDPIRTAEAIDEDGWLHTGDIAEIDADGFVRIVDRKKELIINSAGKNMSPANIEKVLKDASPLIGQAVAIGDARRYVTALIVLDPDGAAAYARSMGLADSSPSALATEPAVHELVTAAVETANARLSRVEQVKRFTILPTDWVSNGDELTPTGKLRRRQIAEKYSTEIEGLYT
ncbi:AMP-dependent synthetase/ligase [Rhodococcus sp. NPDC057014]|uniref:AMP-dependent synthetase/ligase n=1 Tax=Rhodococcus sp. NPDC057014 TaxID=3346000 RepID=UPI003627D21A